MRVRQYTIYAMILALTAQVQANEIQTNDFKVAQPLLSNLEDLELYNPSLVFIKGAYSGSGFSIDGYASFGVGNDISQSSVSFLDNVEVESAQWRVFELFDTYSAEVETTSHRGGYPSGSVVISSNQPHSKKAVHWGIDYGAYNKTRFHGVINMPLFKGAVLTRFAAMTHNTDGNAYNHGTGNKIDNEHIWGLRHTASMKPFDALKLNYNIEYMYTNTNKRRNSKLVCNHDKLTGCSPFNPKDENGNIFGLLYGPGSYGTWVPYLQGLSPKNLISEWDMYEGGDISKRDDVHEIDHEDDPSIVADRLLGSASIHFNYSPSMSLRYTWSGKEYTFESYEDYDAMVSGSNPSMRYVGGSFITGDVGGRGKRNHYSTQAVDRAFDHRTIQKHDISISGRIHPGFDYDLSSFWRRTKNTTDYNIYADYMLYWADISRGPLGRLVPSGYQHPIGGAGFWVGLVENQNNLQGYIQEVLDITSALGENSPFYGLPDNQASFVNNWNGQRDTYNVSLGLQVTALDKFVIKPRLDYTRMTVEGRPYSHLLDLQGNAAGKNLYRDQLDVQTHNNKEEEWTYSTNIIFNYSNTIQWLADYDRGYKPGGNPGTYTFNPERSNYFSLGLSASPKSSFNISPKVYMRNVSGLQISKIIDRSSRNSNVDVQYYGMKANSTWDLFPNTRIVSSMNLNRSSIRSFSTVRPLFPLGETEDFTETDVAQDPNSPLLLSRVYVKKDSGEQAALYKSFGALCTQPFYGLDSTTAPCPADDGVPIVLDDNEVPLAPRFSVATSIEHSIIDVLGGDVTAQVHYFYRSKVYNDQFNIDTFSIPSFHEVSFNVHYKPRGTSAWNLNIYGKNLDGIRNMTALFFTDPTVGGYAKASFRQPRVLGIQLVFNHLII